MLKDVKSMQISPITQNPADIPVSENQQSTLTEPNEQIVHDENRICSICLTEMINADTRDNQDNQDTTLSLTTLRCAHVFHTECVEHWFAISRKQRCPICRMENNPNATTSNSSGVGSSNSNTEGDNSITLLFDEHDDNLHDPLFGSFATSDGDAVFVYESSLGIIMIRTWNLPIDTPLPIIPPNGTVVVPIPTLAQRNAFRTMRRHRRSRFFQFFHNIKRRISSWWHVS